MSAATSPGTGLAYGLRRVCVTDINLQPPRGIGFREARFSEITAMRGISRLSRRGGRARSPSTAWYQIDNQWLLEVVVEKRNGAAIHPHQCAEPARRCVDMGNSCRDRGCTWLYAGKWCRGAGYCDHRRRWRTQCRGRPRRDRGAGDAAGCARHAALAQPHRIAQSDRAVSLAGTSRKQPHRPHHAGPSPPNRPPVGWQALPGRGQYDHRVHRRNWYRHLHPHHRRADDQGDLRRPRPAVRANRLQMAGCRALILAAVRACASQAPASR